MILLCVVILAYFIIKKKFIFIIMLFNQIKCRNIDSNIYLFSDVYLMNIFIPHPRIVNIWLFIKFFIYILNELFIFLSYFINNIPNLLFIIFINYLFYIVFNIHMLPFYGNLYIFYLILLSFIYFPLYILFWFLLARSY